MKKILLLCALLCSFFTHAQTPCINGMATAGGVSYPCSGITLQSYISASTMGAAEAQDSWGWTDSTTGKEYAIVALDNGTAFVDISNPTAPVYLAKLNTNTVSSLWRDVKIYNNYAYIVSEASNHGMQIFDLTRLRSLTGNPAVIYTNAQGNGVYTGITNCHNIIINEDTGFAYLLGSNRNGGAPRILNLSNPTAPTVAGNISSTYGYCHDAQVVIYDGPDPDYQGKELLIGSFSGTDFIKVLDVTNKTSITEISSVSYSNKYYTHQGWFTEDKRFFIVGDEVDEESVGFNTRTMVFDMTDLDNPVLYYTHYGTTAAIDHNGYVKGNRFYLANYSAGMRILKVDGLYEATPSMTEIDFFDTYPANNTASFNATWNVYPFFESGNLIATGFGNGNINGDGGLFVLRDPNFDNVAPTAICRNITVYLDHLGNPVTITAADVNNASTDNMGIISMEIDVDTFTIDDLGPNNVVLTLKDDYGNTSTCTAVVTVADYVPVNYTYDAGTWSPNAPNLASNPSNFRDIVEVLSGTTTLTSDIEANLLHIAAGATLQLGTTTVKISGDINNEGTLIPNTSTIECIGTAPQTFLGAAFTLHNLLLNGSNTVTLNTDVALKGILTPTSGTLETAGRLTFTNTFDPISETHSYGVVAPVTGATITGNVIVERFIPAKRAFRFLSSPVTTTTSIRENWQENGSTLPGYGTHITGTGGATNGFDVSGTNNFSLFTLDVAQQQYQAVTNTNTNTLAAGEAYRLLVRGDRTIDIFNNNATATNTLLRTTGNLHTGNFPVPVVSTVTNGSTLVGNPYQSPVNMETVLSGALNVNQRYYHIWDPTVNIRGAFVTVDMVTNTNSLTAGGGATSSQANEFLQPGQSAFVNTIANGPASIVFNEAHKDPTAIGTGTFLNPVIFDDPAISVLLFDTPTYNANGTARDGLRLLFSEEETSSVDTNDALKSFNIDETIATEAENLKLSIQSRYTPSEDDIIPIFSTNYRTSEYTFKIAVENMPENTRALLIDSFLDTATALQNNEDTSISFTVDSANNSNNPNRFSIAFERFLGVNTNTISPGSITITPNPATDFITISSTENTPLSKVVIFDVIGKKVLQTELNGEDTIRIQTNTLANALYTVKIYTQSGQVIFKKLIKQ